MTSEAQTTANTNLKVSINKNIDGLYAIRQPLISAAIWRRTALSKFQTWIDSLPDKELPSARIALPLDKIHDVLTAVVQISSAPAYNLCIASKQLSAILVRGAFLRNCCVIATT